MKRITFWHWLVLALVISFTVFMACGLALSVWEKGVESSEAATWMQAIGSVAAIVAAFMIADKQHQQTIDRETHQRLVQKREVREVLTSVLQQCSGMVVGIPGPKQQVEDMELYLKLVPRAHFENLNRLLTEAPLYEVGNQQIVQLALGGMEMMDRATRMLQWIAGLDSNERRNQWIHLAGDVANLHFTANQIFAEIAATGKHV